ncbi:MAG: phosphatase PAP2 family protein [Lachnospiraceae bacterium]|nr:phosphatase PAP2 family protein [Lachnospiraceae bacterium]
MPTLILQVRRRVENLQIKKVTEVFAIAFSALMVIGRLISGVHWATDIVASVLLSAVSRNVPRTVTEKKQERVIQSNKD